MSTLLASSIILYTLSDPTLTISWDPVTTDIEGNPEFVVSYEVKIFKLEEGKPDVLVYSNTVPLTTLAVSVSSPVFAGGSWRIEVVAIDAAGLRSDPGTAFYTPVADAARPAAPKKVTVM